MNLKLLPFIAFITLTGCQENSANNTQTNKIEPVVDTTYNYEDTSNKSESETLKKKTGNVGILIDEISFTVKTANKDDFENGIQPWASIEKPDLDLPKLIDRNKIVLKDTLVTLIIDYPLRNEYKTELTSKGGFTKGQLLKIISSHYFKIYEIEETSANLKTIPVDKRTTMYNRNETDGKYGIWGHDIGDLVLSEVMVYKNVDGQIILMLEVQS